MFFAKFAVTLALVTPLVSALGIITPTNWTSSDPASLEWTAAAGDPQSFSIELINQQFNSQFALANNVPTGQLRIDFSALPVVPVSDGYTIQFVNIGNLSDVFTESTPFSIGASIASSTTSSSATSSGSAPPSVSLTSTTATSGFGTTRSNTVTGVTGSATDSGNTSSATTFNNGAVALGFSNANLASFAVMGVAALAGARFVGF